MSNQSITSRSTINYFDSDHSTAVIANCNSMATVIDSCCTGCLRATDATVSD